MEIISRENRWAWRQELEGQGTWKSIPDIRPGSASSSTARCARALCPLCWIYLKQPEVEHAKLFTHPDIIRDGCAVDPVPLPAWDHPTQRPQTVPASSPRPRGSFAFLLSQADSALTFVLTFRITRMFCPSRPSTAWPPRGWIIVDIQRLQVRIWHRGSARVGSAAFVCMAVAMG